MRSRTLSALRAGFLAAALAAVVMPALAAARDRSAETRRWEAVRAVLTSDTMTEEIFLEAIASAETAVRKAGVYRAGGDPALAVSARARYAMPNALRDPAWTVRRLACRALAVLPDSAARTALEERARIDPELRVRTHAITALAALADPSSEPLLRDLLEDSSFAVRGTAAKALGSFPSTGAGSRLRELEQTDPEIYVRVRARESLDRLGLPADASATAVAASEQRTIPIPSLAALVLALVALGLAVFAYQRERGTLVALGVFASMAVGLVLFALGQKESPVPGQVRRVSVVRVAFDSGARHLLGSSQEQSTFVALLAEDAASLLGLGLETAALIPEIATARSLGREQYDAERILEILRSDRGEEGLLLVTSQDIYQEPFYATSGLGAPGVSVVSLRTIDPVYQQEGVGTAGDRVVLRERARRLILHELGHLADLDHCAAPRCLMGSIEEVEEFMGQDATTCGACRETVRGLLQGEPTGRGIGDG